MVYLEGYFVLVYGRVAQLIGKEKKLLCLEHRGNYHRGSMAAGKQLGYILCPERSLNIPVRTTGESI